MEFFGPYELSVGCTSDSAKSKVAMKNDTAPALPTNPTFALTSPEEAEFWRSVRIPYYA